MGAAQKEEETGSRSICGKHAEGEAGTAAIHTSSHRDQMARLQHDDGAREQDAHVDDSYDILETAAGEEQHEEVDGADEG